MIKKIIFGLIGLVLLLLVIGFLLPSEFRVERSISINAPATKVYSHIVDLREWKKWGVWFERDPQMVVAYQGDVGAIGMKSMWQSDTQGNGEMQITALVPDEIMVYSLYFPEMDMGSTGELQLTEKDGVTQVVWLDYGDVGGNPINHYFAAMMDIMIGPDFEAGLANLKRSAEKPAQ